MQYLPASLLLHRMGLNSPVNSPGLPSNSYLGTGHGQIAPWLVGPVRAAYELMAWCLANFSSQPIPPTLATGGFALCDGL